MNLFDLDINLAYMHINSSGKILEYNPTADESLSISAFSIKNIFELFPDITLTTLQDIDNKFFETRLKNNNHIKIKVISKKISNTYIITFFQCKKELNFDITNYLYLFLETTPDFIYLKKIIDNRHVFIVTSKSLAVLCGFEHWEDMIGLDDFDVFSPEYAQQYYDDEQRIIESKDSKTFRQKYLDTDNNIKWVSTKKSLIYDSLGKVIGIFGISRDISELKIAEDRLKELVTLDSLTKIKNRRAFDNDIINLIFYSKRYQHDFVIIHFDIDNFKDINDTYGHQAGDSTLIDFSNRIKGFIRKSDKFYRIGGDEFILLLPETNIAGGETYIKRLRSNFSKDNKDKKLKYTLSIGITSFKKGDTWRTIYKRCDKALYKAKTSGKDSYFIEY